MEFKKICLEKYKKMNNNEINNKLTKNKLKKRIKSNLIIIRSSVDLEQKQLQFDNLFKNYGIDKKVSLRKLFFLNFMAIKIILFRKSNVNIKLNL